MVLKNYLGKSFPFPRLLLEDTHSWRMNRKMSEDQSVHLLTPLCVIILVLLAEIFRFLSSGMCVHGTSLTKSARDAFFTFPRVFKHAHF